MSVQQALFMNYGPQLLVVDSADFDGTNDYMTRGATLTGASDSKTGIFSCWVRIDGGDGAIRRIFNGAGTVGGALAGPRVSLNASNQFQITLVNAAAASILTQNSSAFLAGATWRHVLMAWNLAATTSSLYINDVSDNNVTVGPTDDTIDYTVADWAVGAVADGTVKLDGCLAELYVAFGQYLDFSIVYNRRKFISSSGKPVYLGADGSAPTGTAPIVYQRVADGAAVATFATNLGGGGDFSITGTLTAGSSSPSD